MSSAEVRKHSDWLISGALLAFLMMWDTSSLDVAAVRWFGGASGFPLRNHWLTSGLLHEGGRVLAWVTLASLAVNVWRPLASGPTRAQRWQWLLVTLFCLVAVPALKRASSASCPWDLAEFGGTAIYLSHWQWGATDGGPGHCFPSGHAASAFGFLWGWFALRGPRPALARVWLAAVVVFGAVFGVAQLVRGAHYPSHTLWTAWFCWTICAALSTFQMRVAARQLAPTLPFGPSALRNPLGEEVL